MSNQSMGSKKTRTMSWDEHLRGVVTGAIVFWLVGWHGVETLVAVGLGWLFGAGTIRSFSTLLLSFLLVLKIFFLIYGAVLSEAESFGVGLYSWLSSIAVLSLFIRATTYWSEVIRKEIEKKDPSGKHLGVARIIVTFVIPVLCIGGAVAYNYKELSSTETIFGERLNYYDESIASWEGNRAYSPEVKEDGRIVMKLRPRKKSRYFDEYAVHLLPVSKKNFLISANKVFKTREDAKAHFDHVKQSLSLKYGAPFIDKEFSASYNSGKVEIGLICTDLAGNPMVYVNAFIRTMLENDLKMETREYMRNKDSELDAL